MKNTWVLLFVFLLLQQGCTTTSNIHTDSNLLQQQKEQKLALQQKQLWLSWHKRWVGTPYRYGGNSRSGIDCSSYVQRGYRELFGIELPRTTSGQRGVGIVVSYEQLRIGDLVFFTPKSAPNHVGIYIGDGLFIHVSSSKGVIRSRMDKGYWYKHFHIANRILTI